MGRALDRNAVIVTYLEAQRTNCVASGCRGERELVYINVRGQIGADGCCTLEQPGIDLRRSVLIRDDLRPGVQREAKYGDREEEGERSGADHDTRTPTRTLRRFDLYVLNVTCPVGYCEHPLFAAIMRKRMPP